MHGSLDQQFLKAFFEMGDKDFSQMALVLRDHPGISVGNVEVFHFDQFCNFEFLFKREYSNFRDRREAFIKIIGESQSTGISNFIFDLVDSLNLDGTGLGLYVELIQIVEKGGGIAFFANQNTRVIKIIEYVNLSINFFNYAHSVGDAIRILSPMGESDST